jgi:hypothetical protein
MSDLKATITFTRCICHSQIFSSGVRLLVAGPGVTPDLSNIRVDFAVRNGEWFTFLEDMDALLRRAHSEQGGTQP